MALTLKDHATGDYLRLDLDQSLAESRASLAANPAQLGVVFDRNRPVTMVTLDDLQADLGEDARPLSQVVAQLPPGILARSDVTLREFAGSGAFAALEMGARGAVVTDGDKVVGALTIGSIDDHLPGLDLAQSNVMRAIPDITLAGSIATSTVVLYCEKFRHRNELVYYNRRHPPACQVTTPYTHPILGGG
jgi:hypothetical protein